MSEFKPEDLKTCKQAFLALYKDLEPFRSLDPAELWSDKLPVS